jgi:spore coat polysaccharide biosynthesis protein SpsF
VRIAYVSGKFKTDQEDLWAGQFGDDYISRNDSATIVSSNIALFSKILGRCEGLRAIIEFGANIGLNLRAIEVLRPHLQLEAVEINEKAARQLIEWNARVRVHQTSILDFHTDQVFDLALIKGVLIHINPHFLPQVYESLYRASARYIAIAEYYSPTPVEVPYRGRVASLFKRDFAGEMLEKYPDLHVVDYGFVWRRDPVFAQDDVTWFLLEKAQRPVSP